MKFIKLHAAGTKFHGAQTLIMPVEQFVLHTTSIIGNLSLSNKKVSKGLKYLCVASVCNSLSSMIANKNVKVLKERIDELESKLEESSECMQNDDKQPDKAD